MINATNINLFIKNHHLKFILLGHGFHIYLLEDVKKYFSHI